MHAHVGRGGVALTAPWWRGADRADERPGPPQGLCRPPRQDAVRPRLL